MLTPEPHRRSLGIAAEPVQVFGRTPQWVSFGSAPTGLMSRATSVDKRPVGINERLVPGQWECGLIKGARNQSQIGTLVERTTLFTSLVGLESAMVEHPAQRFGFVLIRLDAAMRLCMTYDNGREMAHHKALSQTTGIQLHFAHPYSFVGARHQREHQRLAAPYPAQRHRPERAQPGRSGRHRPTPQRQAAQISWIEIACQAVLTPRLVPLPSLLGNYHQARCTSDLNPPLVIFQFNLFPARQPRIREKLVGAFPALSVLDRLVVEALGNKDRRACLPALKNCKVVVAKLAQERRHGHDRRFAASKELAAPGKTRGSRFAGHRVAHRTTGWSSHWQG